MSDDDLAALEAEVEREERQNKAKQTLTRQRSTSNNKRAAASATTAARPLSSNIHPSAIADDSSSFIDPYDQIDFDAVAKLTKQHEQQMMMSMDDEEAVVGGVTDQEIDADLRALMRELGEDEADAEHDDRMYAQDDHEHEGGDDDEDELSRLEREHEKEEEEMKRSAPQPRYPTQRALPLPPAIPSTRPSTSTSVPAPLPQPDASTLERMQAESISPSPALPNKPPSLQQTLSSLIEQRDSLRKKALELNRAGKKTEAIDVMKHVKTTEARIQQTSQQIQQQQQPQQQVQPSAQGPVRAAAGPSVVGPLVPSLTRVSSGCSATASLEQLLKTRILEYQRAAVQHKQANRLEKARSLMIEIRRMKQLMDDTTQRGKTLTASDIPPPLEQGGTLPRLTRQNSNSRNSSPNNPANNSITSISAINNAPTLTNPATPLVTPHPIASPPPLPSRPNGLTTKQSLLYQTLLTALQQQLTQLNANITAILTQQRNSATAASPSAASNPTTAASLDKTQKLLALQYHRLKKRTQTDCDIVNAAYRRGLPPPTYHYAMERIAEIHENTDVSDDQLMIHIYTAKDLPAMDASYAVTVRIEWNEALTTCGTSAAIKGSNPVYNTQFMYTFGKRNKLLTRQLSRGKLQFILTRSRMFLSSVEVGRGELKLKDLIMKCDKKEIIRMRDEAGKRVGEMSVEVKLRRPLEKMEIREAEKELLVIDEFEEGDHALHQQQQHPQQQQMVVDNAGDAGDVSSATKPERTQLPSHSQPLATPSKSTSAGATALSPSSASSPAPSPSASSTAMAVSPSSSTSTAGAASTMTATALPAGVTEDDITDPHNVLSIFSNDVLDWELKTHIPTQLTQARVHKDQHAIQEWSDRALAVQSQLTILVTAVQNGKLSLNDYLSKLKESILHDGNVAKELIKRGKKEDAKWVIQRVNIMKQEVQQAEENAEELEG